MFFASRPLSATCRRTFLCAFRNRSEIVYIVLWKAGRPPKSEHVAAKHPAALDRRFVHTRPERKED
jgi:hypothetical protein